MLTPSAGRRAWLLLAAVVLLAAVAQPSQASGRNGGHVFLGASALDLKVDIDTTLDVAGPTHFFSSRHQLHAGGRFTFHSGAPAGRVFYIGTFGGFGWGKNSFLLNWETPDVVSYEPLDSSISFGYLPFGFDYNLVLGDALQLSAFTSVKWIFQRFSLKIGGEEFDGTSSKLVGVLGAMATVNLGIARVSGGASLNRFLNSDVDWDVDDLTFESTHTDPSVEYFLGVVLK